MMRKISDIAFLCILFVATLVSCGEDRTYEYFEMTKENQWTYSKMKEVYLWADSIKTPSQTDFFTSTSKFFTTLKYPGDNVSYFTDTVSLGSYGMTVALMRDPIGVRPSKVYALTLFVEKGSPADIAGIERGTWISSIDGRALSISDATALQQGDAKEVVTEYIEYNDEEKCYNWVNGGTLLLPHSTDIEMCNICIDTIYSVRNQQVGYLFVNSFNGNDFEQKMESVAEQFAASDVAAVIIDLRYNNSGSLSNAASLASYFVPTALHGTQFCALKGNDCTNDTVVNYSAKQFNFADKKLYLIISNGTKGTAELFVNSLNTSRGVSNVAILGKKTAGANMMVERFQSPFGFAINPATAYIYASDDKMLSVNGIQAEYQINELEQVEHIYSLGSEQEYMLQNALYLFVNGTLPSTAMKSIEAVLVSGKRQAFVK